MAPALNIECAAQLLDWLRSHDRIGGAESPRVRTLAGGVSNRTVLVERPNGEAWVLKQALAKLRVAVDWFSPPERVHREALGLRALETLAPPGTITPLVFEDHEAHVIAMRAVPQPHANWKSRLLAGHLDRDHFRQFGVLLGTIHRRAREQAARLRAGFADTSYFEGLRLEPFYEFTANQVPAAAAPMRSLVRETRAHPLTLVHGDFSPKNILVHQDRLILLDHEVIHWGDPTFDFGFALAHLLSKANHLETHRPSLRAGADLFWQAYRSQAGDLVRDPSFEPRAARHALACLLARVAGRSQVEYLSTAARRRQLISAVELLAAPPPGVPLVVRQFLERIDLLSRQSAACADP